MFYLKKQKGANLVFNQLYIFYLKCKIHSLIRKHRFTLTKQTKKRIRHYQYERSTAVVYTEGEIKVYTPADGPELWYVLFILPNGSSGEELTRRLF